MAEDPRLADIIHQGQEGRVVLLGFPSDAGVEINGGRVGARHGNVVVLDDILHELQIGFQGAREKQGGFFPQEAQIETQGEHGAQGIRVGKSAEEKTAPTAQ